MADRVLGDGVLATFKRIFPPPYEGRRGQTGTVDVYKPIVDWFAAGNSIVVNDETETIPGLERVQGLVELVKEHARPEEEDRAALCELVLEGLHRSSLLAKEKSRDGEVAYGDMLKDMFAGFEAP